MRIYNTCNLQPHTKLSEDERSWIYNGLDCCVTAEVHDTLCEVIAEDAPNVRETYDTAMRKVPPVLYMNSVGIRMDLQEAAASVHNYKAELRKLQTNFDHIMTEVFGYTINWRSPPQLQRFFYDMLGLPKKRKRNAHGNLAPTVNADALESFQQYLYPQIFASHILAMRELGKKISFLESEVDTDGRMRTQLNIAGTDTGRFSSRGSAFGTGSNLQNVENALRRPFISDDGYVFVNVDLEQADARNVGARIWTVFHDTLGPKRAGAYLDACESGDLHTVVCSMAWPELPWPDPWDPKAAREVADQIFYRHFSYRDMAKRLGHGTNYFGTPRTMALHTKTESHIIEEFQRRYFRAYPTIGNIDKKLDRNDWHSWVFQQLKDVGAITNLFGRRRIFFDRYKDQNTLRKAIAYEPQSNTGEELDRGWLQLWDKMPEARLVIPVHDSIMFQVPYEGLNELVPRALDLMKVEIELVGGRMFHVPLEAKVGWNWADSKFDKSTGLWKNPHGLRVWEGSDDREAPKPKPVGGRLRDRLRR